MKQKNLTVNDIVAPGDTLDLLRAAMDKVPSLNGVIVITIESSGIGVGYAGLEDEYQAVGYLEAAKPMLLGGDDSE